MPLTSFAKHRRIDVTIDGADQVERGTLNLIKGLGGALLREKIVASASDRMIVVVDETKLVDRLGRSTPLPVETVSFGWQTTLDRLSALGCEPRLRMAGDKPFTTDSGNYIIDCVIAEIPDPAALEARLSAIIGVVESGLFIGLASKIVVGGTGVERAVHAVAVGWENESTLPRGRDDMATKKTDVQDDPRWYRVTWHYRSAVGMARSLV